MTMNPLLASFNHQPVLMADDMSGSIEAFVNYAYEAQLEIAGRMSIDAPQMLDDYDDDYWPEPDSWLASYRPYIVTAGILQIPVRGMLMPGFPQTTSWATGYAYIRKAFDRGINDFNVKGIALVVDSGGGDVRGNFDLVDHIFANRGTKPVRAYAAEHAYSAAYSIASAADTITVAKTGGVGSIGVMTMHLDQSKQLDEMGLKVTLVHYGKHKVEQNSYQPLSPDALLRMQERINLLGELFASTVARNRGVDLKAIRDTEALMFTADNAISNGLADSVGSIDDAITAFAVEMSKEDKTMTTKTDAASTAEITANLATARAEGFTAGKAEGMSEGATGEKTRITGIMASVEGKLRPIAAMAAAMKTAMSVTEADDFLSALPGEAAVVVAPVVPAPKGTEGAAADFVATMNAADHPNLGSQNGDEVVVSRAEAAMNMSGRAPRKT
jgi:signal peptide peptidase SppA